jgi:hypothetical protein
LVEDRGISRHVSEADEFVLQRPVESLVDRIVLGRFDPGPVMFKVEMLARCLEVPVELGSIVSLNILVLPSSRIYRRWRKSREEAELCVVYILAKATLVCRSIAVRIYRFWPYQ